MSGAAVPRLRVVVADDEELVRSGIAMVLAAQPDIVIVGEAADGSTAVQTARRLLPDVVVMDVRMPGTDGIEATRTITDEAFSQTAGRAVPVLVLTTFADDDAVHDALRAGASGYLLKSAAPRDLAAAVREVAAGNAWLDPPVARALLADYGSRSARSAPPHSAVRCLTPREREVLVLLAHGLDSTAIAAHLVLSDATVKTHLGRVLVKLGVHDRAQAVAAAYRLGLVDPQDRLPSG